MYSHVSYGKKVADPPEGEILTVADLHFSHVRGNNVIHFVADPQVREM